MGEGTISATETADECDRYTMKVGFYLTGKNPDGFLFADRLVRSIRETMPDVHIAHLTDQVTAEVYGVDEVRRGPNLPLSLLRSAHYGDVEGEWLFVDTDVIIQKDVRHVFNESFDICVTDRNWPHLKPLSDQFVLNMPYCMGVVFSRSPAFWKHVYSLVAQMSERDQSWFGDQKALADVIREGVFSYGQVPGSVYQYPPATDDDDLSNVAIVHYKGPERKQFLLNRIKRETFGLATPKTSVVPAVEVKQVEAPAIKEVAPSVPQTSPDEMLRIFVGYDPRQPVAFGVCALSIMRHASRPVAVTPLILAQLPLTRRGLTDFTYTRFLVPFLSGYHGRSIFIDSDFLCRADIYELLPYVTPYPENSVFVVHHEGRQTFERPSLMVFNNERCHKLTPEFVENPANRMFDFAWADGIGSLPREWNHLVGYDPERSDAKLVHYTKGIPCWDETKDCEYAKEWLEEMHNLGSTVSFQELMGNSVHVKRQGK